VCVAGTLSTGGTSDTCSAIDCNAGYASDFDGATSTTDCTICAAGSYSTGGAITTCDAMDCDPGDYSSQPGATNDKEHCQECSITF